jgi:hypothetical protein
MSDRRLSSSHRRKAGQRLSDWHCRRGAGHDAQRGNTESAIIRAFPARRHHCKQGRLGVAASGGPLGRGAAVVFQFEQGKLPCLSALDTSTPLTTSSESRMTIGKGLWKNFVSGFELPMTLAIKFATQAEQGSFIRRWRLLCEDVSELSSSAAILIALSRRSDERVLLSVMNRNPVFWNSIISSLQTSSFVAVGRIHDSKRGAYLQEIKKALKLRTALSDVLSRFDSLEQTHDSLITKIVRLRNTTFAHAALNRPVHIAFGFEGVTEDKLEGYWNDLAGATKLLETTVFKGNYGPKFDPDLLQKDIDWANEALDSLKSA